MTTFLREESSTSTTLPDSTVARSRGAYYEAGDHSASHRAQEREYLPTARLYDADPDTQLGRFFELTLEADRQLEECATLLDAGDSLAADDLLMSCKRIFAELLMMRTISDAVGLIALKGLQACADVTAVTDVPELPTVLHRVIRKLRTSPFMSFDLACELADQIESATGALPVAGYNELALELCGAAAKVEATG